MLKFKITKASLKRCICSTLRQYRVTISDFHVQPVSKLQSFTQLLFSIIEFEIVSNLNPKLVFLYFYVFRSY